MQGERENLMPQVREITDPGAPYTIREFLNQGESGVVGKNPTFPIPGAVQVRKQNNSSKRKCEAGAIQLGQGVPTQGFRPFQHVSGGLIDKKLG